MIQVLCDLCHTSVEREAAYHLEVVQGDPINASQEMVADLDLCRGCWARVRRAVEPTVVPDGAAWVIEQEEREELREALLKVLGWTEGTLTQLVVEAVTRLEEREP